jgi:hypothetical protein
VRQIKRLLEWLYRVRGGLFWGFRSFQQNPAGRRDKSHRDFLLLVPKEELNLLQDRHVYCRQQHPSAVLGNLTVDELVGLRPITKSFETNRSTSPHVQADKYHFELLLNDGERCGFMQAPDEPGLRPCW